MAGRHGNLHINKKDRLVELRTLLRCSNALEVTRSSPPPPPPGRGQACICKTAGLAELTWWPKPDHHAPSRALHTLRLCNCDMQLLGASALCMSSCNSQLSLSLQLMQADMQSAAGAMQVTHRRPCVGSFLVDLCFFRSRCRDRFFFIALIRKLASGLCNQHHHCWWKAGIVCHHQHIIRNTA